MGCIYIYIYIYIYKHARKGTLITQNYDDFDKICMILACVGHKASTRTHNTNKGLNNSALCDNIFLNKNYF
jgi:hypothetical protein